MVYLGINLKELRLKKGLTQEQLAYDFGVSSQSISRWENGSTYPDIVMLPVIASYFDVSIDALVGYAKECTKEERERFFGGLRDMDRQEQILQYREMLRKYPNDVHLQFGFVGVLFGIWKNTHDTDLEREIVRLCNRIVSSGDAGMQCGATRCLAFIAKTNGDTEQAMKYVNALPSVLCGRELMAMQIQYDMSFKKALQKFAKEYLHFEELTQANDQ